MRIVTAVTTAFATAVSLTPATAAIAQETLTMSVPPVVSQDHAALLASPDAKLAANKQLVYDMYRIVLQGGHWDRAHEFIAEGYIQHNPNAAQGLAGLIDYVRASRPVREIKDVLDLPLIMLVAEGDYVTTAFVRPEQDANGETYYSSWFDLYRIENGRIAEHWDPMLKSDPKIDPNDKRI
jgi:predicted SnoaL-like aldol condensation-catalyzing enzyme